MKYINNIKFHIVGIFNFVIIEFNILFENSYKEYYNNYNTYIDKNCILFRIINFHYYNTILLKKNVQRHIIYF